MSLFGEERSAFPNLITLTFMMPGGEGDRLNVCTRHSYLPFGSNDVLLETYFWSTLLEIIKKKVFMSAIIHYIPSMSSAYCQWDFKKSFPPTLLTKPLEILLDHKKHKRGNIETCSEQITRMVYRVLRWTLDKPEEGLQMSQTRDRSDYQLFVSGFTIVKSHRRLLQLDGKDDK